MDEGRWFTKSFYNDEQIDSVSDLQKMIDKEGIKFISKLQYFSKTIPGSDAYWRQKKHEIFTWISHHVKEGNGPPAYFMTLSCAEYHWRDLQKLINEKRKLQGKLPLDLSILKNRINAMNEHAIIIQEYFVERVESFLKTFCKEVLGIEHYYVRFEFAKSRGQIHAHLIAILGKLSKLFSFNDIAFSYRDDLNKQAKVLDKWMTETLGLTASFPSLGLKNNKLDVKNIVPPEGTAKVNPETHPCSQYLSEIVSYTKDLQNLCNYCQKMHVCSDYCLVHAGKNKKRKCRFNFGEEKNLGKADTPGCDLKKKQLSQLKVIHCIKKSVSM
ncbi:MAG: hypothetical protein V2I33_21465, partial [Kangiellaceae bacterium]|nr:hypothetical protein [Kangiellaceae bacterium]